jgi:serine/threonine protein kinase
MYNPSSERIHQGDISNYYIQIEDYERMDFLGKGVYGEVSSWRHKTTRRIVAMKTLFSRKGNIDPRTAYDREVESLAALRHPAILPLLGCTPFDGLNNPLIATPLMQCSVHDLINGKKGRTSRPEWTLTRKHIILIGIAEGMRFMHEKRVIHRDLKPENVLLDESFETQTGDFGFAKFFDEGGSILPSRDVGSPLYMAPEMFESESITIKSDIYSFGILMVTILAGHLA